MDGRCVVLSRGRFWWLRIRSHTACSRTRRKLFIGIVPARSIEFASFKTARDFGHPTVYARGK